MAQKQQEQKPRLYVTISAGGKTARFETWRYWEIVGELQFMGVYRCDAIEAAKWAAKAQAGERIITGKIEMEATNEGNK